MDKRPTWDDGKKSVEVVLPSRAGRFSATLTAMGKRCLPIESDKLRLSDLAEADVCVVAGDPFYQLIRPAAEISRLGFKGPIFIEITKEEAELPKNLEIAHKQAIQLGASELLGNLVYLSKNQMSPRELQLPAMEEIEARLPASTSGQIDDQEALRRQLSDSITKELKGQSNIARQLVRLLSLDVEHALYSRKGDWYHQLKRFPGALLDERGYLIFESEDSYLACPELKRKKDLRVPKGIATIVGYTLFANGDGSSVTYDQRLFEEGERRQVVQSRIERNPASRSACILAHGTTCSVCNFDFGKVYGTIGKGFIHAHHLHPVSAGIRDVDPVADMRPLCPNCHAMAHRENPPISVERLKELIWRHA